MATLKIEKPLTTDDVFKGETEQFGPIVKVWANDLTWFMISRDSEGPGSWSDDSDDMRNLFMSFGISREDDNDWFKAINGVTDYYNANRMLIGAINNVNFDSYIDGSTLRLNVPSGLGVNDYYTLYGSTFNGAPYEDSTDSYIGANTYDVDAYGGAFCYLFANTDAGEDGTINAICGDRVYPYAGTYDGAQHPNYEYVTGTTNSWIASSSLRTAPHLRASHANHATGEGQDTPVGIAFLEKGLFVIFDMGNGDGLELIKNTPSISGTTNSIWDEDGTNYAAYIRTDKNDDNEIRKGVHFAGIGSYTSGVIHSQVEFRSVNKEYKMIYFCHAATTEFNSTTNHTYNHAKGYFTPSQADSIYVTEIALFGPGTSVEARNNKPIAYAKLSEPVKKDILETITFKVSLSL